MHASCTSGHIGWHHPYGAVNLYLQLPNSPAFVLCFSATAIATTATISLETVDAKTGKIVIERLVTLEGARGEDRDGIQQQQHQESSSSSSSSSSSVREVCIESTSGTEVKLYLEAEMHHESTVIGHVEMEYDMEAVNKKSPGQLQDDMEGKIDHNVFLC